MLTAGVHQPGVCLGFPTWVGKMPVLVSFWAIKTEIWLCFAPETPKTHSSRPQSVQHDCSDTWEARWRCRTLHEWVWIPSHGSIAKTVLVNFSRNPQISRSLLLLKHSMCIVSPPHGTAGHFWSKRCAWKAKLPKEVLLGAPMWVSAHPLWTIFWAVKTAGLHRTSNSKYTTPELPKRTAWRHYHLKSEWQELRAVKRCSYAADAHSYPPIVKLCEG
jgi:hypothetical protein